MLCYYVKIIINMLYLLQRKSYNESSLSSLLPLPTHTHYLSLSLIMNTRSNAFRHNKNNVHAFQVHAVGIKFQSAISQEMVSKTR